MEDTLLEKIKKPLKLEIKKDYQNTAVSNGLDKYVMFWAEKGIVSSKDKQTKTLFLKLYELFRNYATESSFLRKEKVTLGLKIIEQIAGREIKEEVGTKEKIEEKKVLFELNIPIQYLKGVGPQRAKFLKTLKIITISDLLQYFPRDYRDYRQIDSIKEAVKEEKATVCGKVIGTKIIEPRRKFIQKIFKVIIMDKTAVASLLFFQQQKLFKYLEKTFINGQEVIVTGKFNLRYGEIQSTNFDYEIINKEEEKELTQTGRIVPVYKLSEKAKILRLLRNIIKTALDKYSPRLMEILPQEYLLKYNFPLIEKAINTIHYPSNFKELEEAQKRLVFEELFFLQLAIAIKKHNNRIEEKKFKYKIKNKLVTQFYKKLKFELTYSQKKVIEEITKDLLSSKPMNRLLQGDVGSGKTIVAIVSMLIALENGYQAAIMVPTEILAEQHYINISSLVADLKIKVVLLISNLKKSNKTKVLEEIKTGKANIIIGTHALIQENVKFDKLALVIIDEQHRFGVMQRYLLREKGLSPEVLVMTATPIPRTLCLTVYGDLDVSVIDELPPERGKIITTLFYEKEREKVYTLIYKEVKKGHQVYIIYPLVEESEKLDLKAATEMHKHLKQDIFPEFNIGLMHGKLKTEEKERIMQEFKENKINILVSTTVIEVGIDIPNVTIMVIEHSERFGLAQLHQLRGRIGRGKFTSFCVLLISPHISLEAKERLKIFTQTNDGFKIAEEDLKQRGPGEFFGIRQHGLPDFKIANLIKDMKILQQAREEAFDLIEKNPQLLGEEYKLIKKKLILDYKDKMNLMMVG